MQNPKATPLSNCDLTMPHVDLTHPIRWRVSKLLPDRLACKVEGHYWHGSFFGLEQCTVYQKLSKDARDRLLRQLSQMLLTESFYIERAGMYFAPKMALLAESIEERQLYCTFSQQEANHYQMITAHMDFIPEHPDSNPFLLLLKSAIEKGGRSELQFLVQVVLEGWGITHYRDMLRSCLSPSLQGAFSTILIDESHHHGAGVSLFESERLSLEERKRLIDTMSQFLQMVRTGPIGVLLRLSDAADGLSHDQLVETFAELQHSQQTSNKLRILKGLMLTTDSHWLVEALERQGLFQPASAESSLKFWHQREEPVYA